MRSSRRLVINVVLAAVIIGAIVTAAIVFWPRGASASAATQLTSTVQQGTVSSTVTASGSIAAKRTRSPAFSVSGTVGSIKVKVGSVVTKGQVLATLKTADLQRAVDNAYTGYLYATQNLSAVRAEKNVQTSQLNSAKQQVTSAKQAWDDAKAQLAGATLKAPIAGVVTAVNVTVGGQSGGDGGAFQIADTSGFTVTANIAEADIADVSVGQAATVTFPALEDATAEAEVTAIAPTATASNSTVSYATTITLTSAPENLRLGQTAEVAITIESSAADALYVPAAAITTASDGTSTVDVVAEDGTTSSVAVTTGVVGDAGTEITSGLTAGQTIVIGTLSASDSTSGTTVFERGGLGGTGGTFGGTGFGPGTAPIGGDQ